MAGARRFQAGRERVGLRGGRRLARGRARAAEVTFYVQQCGVKSLDRCGDGIPCASVCC